MNIKIYNSILCAYLFTLPLAVAELVSPFVVVVVVVRMFLLPFSIVPMTTVADLLTSSGLLLTSLHESKVESR